MVYKSFFKIIFRLTLPSILLVFTLGLLFDSVREDLLNKSKESNEFSVIDTVISYSSDQVKLQEVIKSYPSVREVRIDQNMGKELANYLAELGLEHNVIGQEGQLVFLKIIFKNKLIDIDLDKFKSYLVNYFGEENVVSKAKIEKLDFKNKHYAGKHILALLIIFTLFINRFVFLKTKEILNYLSNIGQKKRKIQFISMFFIFLTLLSGVGSYIWGYQVSVLLSGYFLIFTTALVFMPKMIAFNKTIAISSLIFYCINTQSHASVNYLGLSKKYLNEITSVRGKLKKVDLDLDELNYEIMKSYKIIEKNRVEVEEIDRKMAFIKRDMTRNQKLFSKLVLGSFLIREDSRLGIIGDSLQIEIKKKSEEFKLKQNTRLRVIAGLLLEKNKLQNMIWAMEDAEAKARLEISNLENKKNVLSSDYFTSVDAYKNAIEKIKQQDQERHYQADDEGSFFKYPVLVDRKKIRYEENGLTFSLSPQSKVFAPESGKIAHVDNIAMVGNILLIEHDRGLHSVLIGDFDTKKGKGDLVKKGEFIGLAKNRESNNDLRFELRKNSKLQDVRKYLTKL